MKNKKKSKKSTKARLQRWVVKAGSNIVCSGGPLLIRAWMHQVAHLKKEFKVEIVWVTSGAIASAVDRTQFKKRNRLLEEKQALSAIGQPMVMDLYNLALHAQGLLGGQILLTYDDLANKSRSQCFKNTIEQLLEWGVTPILNENDAVANEEIKFGDNDSLSAKVAKCIGADRLVILTDVDGLYDADPRNNPQAQLIRRLPEVNTHLLAKTTPSSGTTRGTGGMYSKLKAASEASSDGIETWLVKGDIPSILIHVAQNHPVGTQIGGNTGGHQ
jgi:glutamate 5-kinase